MILYEVPRIIKFTEMESRAVVTRDWERRQWRFGDLFTKSWAWVQVSDSLHQVPRWLFLPMTMTFYYPSPDS